MGTYSRVTWRRLCAHWNEALRRCDVLCDCPGADCFVLANEARNEEEAVYPLTGEALARRPQARIVKMVVFTPGARRWVLHSGTLTEPSGRHRMGSCIPR